MSLILVCISKDDAVHTSARITDHKPLVHTGQLDPLPWRFVLKAPFKNAHFLHCNIWRAERLEIPNNIEHVSSLCINIIHTTFKQGQSNQHRQLLFSHKFSKNYHIINTISTRATQPGLWPTKNGTSDYEYVPLTLRLKTSAREPWIRHERIHHRISTLNSMDYSQEYATELLSEWQVQPPVARRTPRNKYCPT
jgi:hypothetical protein